MTRLSDGTVVSSYFDVVDMPSWRTNQNAGLRMVLGQVSKIHFTDDSTNLSKSFVEYDVLIADGKGGMSTFTNLRKLETLFSGTDYDETILEDSSISYTSGLITSKTSFKSKNGTVVIVAFLNGSIDKPFILGTINHPRKVGSKREKGIRKSGEFRGFQWEITKDGELNLTYNGSRNLLGLLERPTTGPLRIKIDKTGKFSILDQENQSIVIDRTSKTIELKQLVTPNLPNVPDPTTGELKETLASVGVAVNSIKMDKNAQTIELKAGITPSSIKVGATEGIIAQDALGAKLKINTNKVALGNSTIGPTSQCPMEVVALLAKIATLLSSTTAPGFGAPLSSSANFATLATEINTFLKGSL